MLLIGVGYSHDLSELIGRTLFFHSACLSPYAVPLGSGIGPANFVVNSKDLKVVTGNSLSKCRCNTTRPSVRALVRVRVSVTIITRRGSCGFCPSFVTSIYTRAHRRWWRVSTV